MARVVEAGRKATAQLEADKLQKKSTLVTLLTDENFKLRLQFTLTKIGQRKIGKGCLDTSLDLQYSVWMVGSESAVKIIILIIIKT